LQKVWAPYFELSLIAAVGHIKAVACDMYVFHIGQSSQQKR
jgi:hypothetical protein